MKLKLDIHLGLFLSSGLDEVLLEFCLAGGDCLLSPICTTLKSCLPYKHLSISCMVNWTAGRCGTSYGRKRWWCGTPAEGFNTVGSCGIVCLTEGPGIAHGGGCGWWG